MTPNSKRKLRASAKNYEEVSRGRFAASLGNRTGAIASQFVANSKKGYAGDTGPLQAHVSKQ